MAKKDLSNLKNNPEFKAIGVTDVKQDGNKYSLLIDPSKLNTNQKKAIAGGLSRSNATLISNQPWDAPYFEGVTSNAAMFNTHDKMRLAMRYEKTDPLAGKLIEMLKTYSNDGFKNQHKNRKVKEFYDGWNYAVNWDQVLDWIFFEYFRSGNVVTMRELIPYKEEDFDNVVNPLHTKASLYKSIAEKKKMWSKQMIPAAYTVLNPLTVYVKELNGYTDNLYFNVSYNVNKEIEGFSQSDPTDILLKQLAPDVRKRAEILRKGEIPLVDKNVKRILRKRQPYEAYGSPIMERCFAALHEKNKLRMMDLTMVNSMVNQIIKVTIGNDTYPASTAQLKKLAEAFRNIGKSQTIFWNHTLDIEVIVPDSKILGSEKYQRVDQDIRNAFGVSEVILGGGGAKTNFATAYLSLKMFISNIIDARRDVIRWMKAEYDDIAAVMQFDSSPQPMFNELALTDEVAEKQILMQMVDRNMISYQSAQLRMGFDPQVELERKQEELPLIEEGLLGITGSPYQQQQGGDGVTNSKDEVKKQVKKEDSKQADSEDSITKKQNITLTKTNSPVSPAKKSGDSGRPSTPKGSYPKSRKSAKAAEEELEVEITDEDQEELPFLEELKNDPEREKSTILSIASEFSKKLD